MLSKLGGMWLIKIMISREEGANSAGAGGVRGQRDMGLEGGRAGLKRYENKRIEWVIHDLLNIKIYMNY